MHALFLLLLALFVSAQPGDLPRFETAPCPRYMPTNVDCGYLTVPEDRTTPDSHTIRLAVAIFRTISEHPAPDPLLFLDGGPGSRTIDAWGGGLDQLILHVGRSRDVIVFDQRGMGYSEPALTCPEQVDPTNADWLRECHDRLVSEGVNLATYTTRENAADAADLMKALGYTSYNVWGGSYGSSLALALLRDHPEGIRSVVVTALQPPQVSLDEIVGPMFQRTINQISDQCANDAVCSAAFPGSLSEKLGAIVQQLDENPLSVEISGQTVTLNGATVINGLGQLLKDTSGLANAPMLIEALYRQQYDVVIAYSERLSSPPDGKMPIGAFWSIRCTDSALAATPEGIEAGLASIDPALRDHFRQQYQTELASCRMWGAHVPTAAELSPAVSDVPVLILNGEFDPYSSPDNVASVLASLPNGHAFWFPGYGHGVNTEACAQSILYDFVTDPAQTPDARCIERIPNLRFNIPQP